MNFLQLFEGSDMFYLADPTDITFKKNGGVRWGVKKEFRIPLAKAIEGHITGTLKKGVVLPPIRKSDNKCKGGAIDVDGNIYKDDNFKREILDKIKKLALPLVACFSKSKGLHLYIRFEEWTDAQKVIDILHTFLHQLGLPDDTECFPKQAKVEDTGNGIMLPFMHGVGNDWIKQYNGKGFITGAREEFEEYLYSKRVNAEDIKIELPPKSNGSKPKESQTKYSKFQILKKIKEGTIEAHPTMGGKYHSWIQVVIAKCIEEDWGDNEIRKLIKEVHQDNRGLKYTWPESYQKQIDYTRRESRFNKPNPGDTDFLEGKGLLDGFMDEELERKQNEFFEDTIYIKLDDRWYSKKTGKEYKEKTIKVVNGHLFDRDVVREFSKDEERKQEVEMGVYRPDLWKSNDDPIVIDEDNLKQLNEYRPGGPEAMEPDTPQRKKELQLFKDLIRKLTEHEKFGFTATGEKRPLYDYVLDHLSMPFQRRGVKIRSSIVMHSVENQVGKSTLFEIVETGLGKDNCIVITPENACRREKAFLPHQLVLIDELLIDGDYKKRISVLNVLKPLMTADKHDCRPLFKESRQIYSTCSFMCFTNHKDAVAIKEFDARYTCIDVNKNREQMGGDEFFHKIWNPDGTLKGTIANVVKHFLSTRKISVTFDPAGISLDTEFRKTMSEHGGHPMFSEVKTRLNQRLEPFNRSIISISEVHQYLKEKRVKGSLNELAEALEKLGCVKIGECKHGRTGKHPMMYIVRNKEFFDGMTNVEIINNYWLPTECNSQSTGSETWNLSGGDLSDIRKHLTEIEKYEELMEKEEKPEVIRIEGGKYTKAILKQEAKEDETKK